MIVRNQLLNNTSSELSKSVHFLERSINVYDLFIVATSDSELEEVTKFEKRQGLKVTKANWLKLVSEKKGLIFFVTSGHFRRKSDVFIEQGLEQLKTHIKNESSSLFVDQLTKHEKFDVFFIGQKKAIEKETENENNSSI